jgi:C_GCAxxG_C_C family probable redox protein
MLTPHLATQTFSQGFNCAQSVLYTYGKQYFTEPTMALKLASAFGAGITYRGETCGAVTGALMALGLQFGYSEVEMELTKQRCMGISKEFTALFEQKHGAIQCKQLLKVDISTPEGLQSAREQGLFGTVCPGLIESASEILDELLTKYQVS